MTRSRYAVLIMAAGRGERLKELGPKPLLKIGGKPVLLYGLELARQFQPEETVVFLSEAAKEGEGLLINDERPVIVSPTGTAAIAARAVSELSIHVTYLLICHADDAVFMPKDIFDKLARSCEQANVNIAVTTTRVTAPTLLGSVKVDDDGFITGFSFDRELPAPKLILSGIFVIERQTFSRYLPLVPLDDKGERSVVALIKAAFDQNEKILTVPVPEECWRPLNTPEDLKRAKALKGGE